MRTGNNKPYSNEQAALSVEVANSLKPLTNIGKASFIKLCEKGCDPEFIESSLLFLFSRIQITGKSTTRTSNGKTLTETFNSSLRPLDSVEEALGDFTRKKINDLRDKLLRIAEQLESLNSTNLVRSFGSDDIYFEMRLIPSALTDYANKIIPLIQQELKQIGDRKKPGFNKYLRELMEHVMNSTGSQNYKLLCDVLNDYGLDCNEESLKQRWSRQKTSVKSKVTRNRPK